MSTLQPGARLGVFEIGELLGEGGMGQVFRARDTRLGRDVALKILPADVAGDPARVARFQREAQLLAALNHPNIAVIHGLEESGNFTALVLELVDGPTLADRIARGPIPVDEALRLATQVAQALEGAHAAGIIHRDLKPGNIKLRADGTVKVLDFGLAKALDSGRATAGAPEEGAPTVTMSAATQPGLILGTPAYMSPEQATGRPADRRSDVWAFGAVLYEMLTGRRAFEGRGTSETLASVLRGPVDWNDLPTDLPPVVRAFLVRCVERDPRRRLHDISDMRLALEGAFDLGPSGRGVAGAAALPRWRRMLPPVAAAAVAVAVTVLAVRAPVVDPPLVYSRLLLPAGAEFVWIGRPLLALSPDGTRVAYVAGDGLWVQDLDQPSTRLMPGTGPDTRQPFFSADGRWIVYYEAGEMRRVSATGDGAHTLVTPVDTPWWGATWGTDDTILFAQGSPFPQGPGEIWQVPADGGEPEQVLVLNGGERAHRPQRLPGGEWVLYTLRPSGVGSWNRARIVVESIETGDRRVLIEGGRDAHYLPTGHIVYALNGQLLATPFDPDELTVDVSRTQTLVSGVFDAGTVTGATHFDVATNGTLVYVPVRDTAVTMTLVDRSGGEDVIPAPPRAYRLPRMSRDGTRIAVEIEERGNTDVHIVDVLSGRSTRLTTDAEVESHPVWMPDGEHVVYSAVRGAEGLFMQKADGSEPERHVTDGAEGIRALDFTPDGKVLYEALQGAEVLLVPPDGSAPPEVIPVFDDPAFLAEILPALSPDGRWLAYQSNEGGESEVWVRPFPGTATRRWQVSQDGGAAPLWSDDGTEIFYRGSTHMMGRRVRTDPTFDFVGAPVPLFSLSDYVFAGIRGIRYDVTPDDRFLLLKDEIGGAPRDGLVLVQNWLQEVERRVPSD